MMNRKKKAIIWAVLLAVAALIVLAVAGFEGSTREGGTALLVQSLSDGFFTVAVLYIGCSILIFIQEAGNFYGVQFLFYTLRRLFVPQKDRAQKRKTYFDYCLEKRERQAAEGKTPVNPAMFLMGLACLALSLLFTALFYNLP